MIEAELSPQQKLFARTVTQYPPKPINKGWILALAGLVIVVMAIGAGLK